MKKTNYTKSSAYTALIYLSFSIGFLSCADLKNNGVDKSPYNLPNEFELVRLDTINDSATYTIYQSGNDLVQLLEIKQFNPSEVDHYMKNKRAIIEKLYADQPSPYPGNLSKKIGCPDSLKPSFYSSNENRKLSMWCELYANKRKVYGVCDSSSIHYKSIYLINYCIYEKTLYEIKYFTPVSDSIGKSISRDWVWEVGCYP